MSLATVLSRAQSGMEASLITIEVHLANGLPNFMVVGLPEAAVRESKDRVRGAIMNSGFNFPNKRITVNLAPADIPKEGSRYDLAIALGILVASGQMDEKILEDNEFIGELALSGEVRTIRGVLPSALACAKAKHKMILPHGNEGEAALIKSLTAYKVKHILDVLSHSQGQSLPLVIAKPSVNEEVFANDFSDVKGQEHAKRALLIAASGAHNVLMVGPPGTGKSMLASRISSILPDMTETESLETASLYSISHHGFSAENWSKRPFRRPHHTSSSPALVGGGSIPKPGEISLAHNGVLFLDELPEFSRQVLEVLREPMEIGSVSIARANRQTEFPANFQLIAAMNPCPCGYHGDKQRACSDTPDQIKRYRQKISGPFLDRIDILLEVNRIEHSKLNEPIASENSSLAMKKQVEKARQIQYQRQDCVNTNLTAGQIEKHCQLDEQSSAMLIQAAKNMNLSMRSYHRIQKLARTIADLDEQENIAMTHLAEAIQLHRMHF